MTCPVGFFPATITGLAVISATGPTISWPSSMIVLFLPGAGQRAAGGVDAGQQGLPEIHLRDSTPPSLGANWRGKQSG